MSRDGGLRSLFQRAFPEAHWQAIETWSTGQGVPDMEFCFKGGKSGWIENKLTSANAVDIRSEQVGWIERRVRVGGRVFIAVRKFCKAGPRRAAADELHLFHGRDVRAIFLRGLVGAEPMAMYENGPANWDWPEIRRLITG